MARSGSRRWLAAAAGVAVAVTMAVVACSGKVGSADKLSIAVIPKGTTHEFWKAIHAGAVKAERELNAAGTPVAITWKGPLREDDREQQVQVVEGFVSQNVSGIVIAPLDERALVRPIEEAKRAGIPTIVIDSGLDTKEIVSFVATDNTKGGELAADRMQSELVPGFIGRLTQEPSMQTLTMSPTRSAPRPSAPPAQCSTDPPSKWPPQRTSVSPSLIEYDSPAQNVTRGSGRQTHFASASLR